MILCAACSGVMILSVEKLHFHFILSWAGAIPGAASVGGWWSNKKGLANTQTQKTFQLTHRNQMQI